MKKLFILRDIVLSFIVLILLTVTFFQNGIFEKIILTPFLVCSLAVISGNIFSLLNKVEITKIFSRIFRISLLIYVFGFLSYMIYYSITNKSYSLLFIAIIFLLFVINFVRIINKKH